MKHRMFRCQVRSATSSHAVGGAAASSVSSGGAGFLEFFLGKMGYFLLVGGFKHLDHFSYYMGIPV